jgi:hypothetical protein
MWDSFAAGVAFSAMRNGEANGGNEFAELEYMNITVITSNEPYGVRDGSNPLFDARATPKFGLEEGGVHSGHVQTGIRDSFCLVPGSNSGRCQVTYPNYAFRILSMLRDHLNSDKLAISPYRMDTPKKCLVQKESGFVSRQPQSQTRLTVAHLTRNFSRAS